MPDVKDMAARLIQAEWDRATIAPFSDADPGIDIEAACTAQWAFVQSKLDAGYKPRAVMGTRQSRWPGWPTASAHVVSACARDGWCCPVASPRRCRSNRARPSRQNWTGWVRWRSTLARGHSVSSWRRLVRVSSTSSDPRPDRMVRVAYKVKPLIWP